MFLKVKNLLEGRSWVFLMIVALKEALQRWSQLNLTTLKYVITVK